MTALAWLSLLVWAYLILARGGFWRIAPDMLPARAADARPAPSVLAIVPARNEAAVIGETLPSLLAQDFAGPFHVLLVDDDSEDGTADAAVGAAAGRSGALTVLHGRPLPPGWTGKLWAMHQGVRWATEREAPPDLILFTDADIRYAPDVLARLVAQSRAKNTVLASLMVRLRAESFAERTLIPAFVFFFRMLYPFRRVGDPASRCAAAAGGAMLADRRALAKAGGLEAIRGAIIDDCALGALMKRQGPLWLGLAGDVWSVRPSPAVSDIRRMVARTAYAELRYSPARLVVALFGLGLVFAVPPLAAILTEGTARIAGIAGWAAMTLAFLPMVVFYRAPLWTALALPAIAATYAFFTLDSAVQHWRGRGGAWKGRVQARLDRSAET